jgi:signal transduction histidine kinase
LRYIDSISSRWAKLSLAWQFFMVGGLALFAVMLVVGLWVTSQIRDGVIRNSGGSTALYVDSVIAPLLPDMRKSEQLSDNVKRALDETLDQGALGKRLVSFKLWRRDGKILYAKDSSLIGKVFAPGPNLLKAFNGSVVAQFDNLDPIERQEQKYTISPVLEIYNPVREPWSGEVVAVSEFYEVADDFKATLETALWQSWLVVAGATAAALAMLSGIVLRGSRTIQTQRRALEAKVAELQTLLMKNSSLRDRVQRASRRATAINERYLRRIGADLHDGPAQLVALAALRMDGPLLLDSKASLSRRKAEIAEIHHTLDEAMGEIRAICNGLVLPQIESAAVADILRLAVAEHERRTASSVSLSLPSALPELGTSEKISVYRFVQEGLNNAWRHGKGKDQAVKARLSGNKLLIQVVDGGPGFAAASSEGLGLSGLRERIESIGGHFYTSSSRKGTRLTISLSIEEQQ